jgi:hypothetical protein
MILMNTDFDTTWKSRALLIGGFLGALTGLGVAYFLVRRAEEEEYGKLEVSPGEGVRLGLLLLGLLRQVSEIGGE